MKNQSIPEHEASLLHLLDVAETGVAADGKKSGKVDPSKDESGSATTLKIKKRVLKRPLQGFVLSSVLSKKECEGLLRGAAAGGRKFTFWNPDELDRTDTRNVDTIEVRDAGVAGEIWRRVRHLVAEKINIPAENDDWEYGLEGTWQACGINPRLLFGRYGEEGHFSPHTDGHVIIDFNHRSMYSVIIYLNDCKQGGSTQLMIPDKEKRYKFEKDKKGRYRLDPALVADRALPRAGNFLAFSQHLMHEGEPVGPGCVKYIIRTDVMYERIPPVCDGPDDLKAYQCFLDAGEAEGAKDYYRAGRLYSQVSRLSEKLARMLHVYTES